jgi:PAS domain S-box-containing protein
MGAFLRHLLTTDLMPHGRCWGWEPWVVWTNVVPDALIALAYFVISLTLFEIIRKRRETMLNGLVLLFGAFILACGVTHAMEVINTWSSLFRLAGVLKILTALVSLVTAYVLLRLVPKLVATPNLEQALALKHTLHREVGERRTAQRELQESQEGMRLLIDGVKDYAIFMLDPDGRIVTWNQGAERIKGYAAQEVIGQSFARFYPPEDAAAGLPDSELAQARAEGSFASEGWRVRKDGTRFMASVAITALRNAQGELKGFAKVTRDITKQKEAEEQLRSFNEVLENRVRTTTQELSRSEARLQGFIRHAPAAIAFKGTDGRFLLINPRMETLLARPVEQIIDHTYGDLFPPELGEAMRVAEQQVLRDGHSLEEEEEWVHAGGDSHAYITQKFPLLDSLGQCWGLGLISTDITGRKEADRTLLQGQKLESLGILAGGIAHDFNNLLGAILGNLGLAQMENSPMSPIRHRLDTIEALVVKAADLTRQMLAYSGRGKFMVRSVNLSVLVTEMTHLLGISISKKATLKYEIQSDLPNMEADPTQIQQVVMNLVINASDAIGDRNGTITIRTGTRVLDPAFLQRVFDGQELTPGTFVTLEVSDNGSGMSPETLKRIFDPFFTTKFTGRGLGLAALQGIVRGHHGGIRVYSELGKGTIFRLLFPTTNLAPEAPPLQDPPQAYRGSGLILVVDDEDSILTMATTILERVGFRTLKAADGLEALARFEEHREELSLILMDLTMPKLDGEETYRALRHRGSVTPVILSSGFNETEAINRFLGKGLAGFLQKPYTAANLVEMVKKALTKGATDPTSGG